MTPEEPKATIAGVNQPFQRVLTTYPTTPDQKQAREVLLVDPAGQPLLVRQARPVGFRRP